MIWEWISFYFPSLAAVQEQPDPEAVRLRAKERLEVVEERKRKRAARKEEVRRRVEEAGRLELEEEARQERAAREEKRVIAEARRVPRTPETTPETGDDGGEWVVVTTARRTTSRSRRTSQEEAASSRKAAQTTRYTRDQHRNRKKSNTRAEASSSPEVPRSMAPSEAEKTPEKEQVVPLWQSLEEFPSLRKAARVSVASQPKEEKECSDSNTAEDATCQLDRSLSSERNSAPTDLMKSIQELSVIDLPVIPREDEPVHHFTVFGRHARIWGYPWW